MSAIKQNGRVIQSLSLPFQTDRDCVLLASQTFGDVLCLDLVPDEFKKDREITLSAVKHSDNVFEQVVKTSFHLIDDEMVIAALQRDGQALKYASQELKSNKKFVLKVVSKYGSALEFVDEKLKADIDVVTTAILSHPSAILFADPIFKENKEL